MCLVSSSTDLTLLLSCVLFLLHCFFFSFFSLFSSLSFPFSFLFLFPDWMNLCSVLFSPSAYPIIPGTGVEHLVHYFRDTAWYSKHLLKASPFAWSHDVKERCMIFLSDFYFWSMDSIFFPHSHTKQNTGGMRLFSSFFFLTFLPKPPIWSPNVSVHHFLRGLWLLWLCQICPLLWWSYSVYWCVLRDPLLLSACFQRFIQTVISLHRWTRV